MKETLKQAGYTYIRKLDHNLHLLADDTGKREIWASNKNHAGYGLIYKNTHLEFCSSSMKHYGIEEEDHASPQTKVSTAMKKKGTYPKRYTYSKTRKNIGALVWSSILYPVQKEDKAENK